MNQYTRRLMLSLKKLEEWLPEKAEKMYAWFMENPEHYVVEGDDLIYCLFSYPCQHAMERCILLVYDKDVIIADMSGYIGKMSKVLFNAETKKSLTAESDWMDLQQYILEQLYRNDPHLDDAPVFLETNAYVTRSYRKHGIFTTMENMIHDYVLRDAAGTVIYYSIFSLDPDVAYYGPDAVNEPYIYDYEADEPVRQTNAVILEKIGYKAIRLDADDIGDGTRIWFAVKKELDEIMEK